MTDMILTAAERAMAELIAELVGKQFRQALAEDREARDDGRYPSTAVYIQPV